MPWICSKISNESKVRYAGQGAKQWILGASDMKKILKKFLNPSSKSSPKNSPEMPSYPWRGGGRWRLERRKSPQSSSEIAPLSRSSSWFFCLTSLWKTLNSSPKNSIFLFSVAAGEICFAYFFLSKSPSFNSCPTVFMPRSQGQTRKRQKNFHPLLPARKSVLPADLRAIGRVLSDAGKLKK